ncbi:hypothetical protein ABFT80_06090 [Mesorhizobium sp. SB112]|uniref:hypothetical protein n=1 Tax=Mesorhizobium sp. SB112 TaxID=3151853 RepID=UPI0032638AA2
MRLYHAVMASILMRRAVTLLRRSNDAQQRAIAHLEISRAMGELAKDRRKI